MMQQKKKKKRKSHLYFNVVDVRCEADDNSGVVGIVFFVYDTDVYVNLAFSASFNHCTGEINENCQHAYLR